MRSRFAFWVAHASRVLASASSRSRTFLGITFHREPDRTKDCFGETPKTSTRDACATRSFGAHRQLWFRGQYQRRRTGRFQVAHFFETGLFEPTLDFIKAESVAALAVHEHVYCENQSVWRSGAIVFHQPLGDRDRGTRIERAKNFLE